MKLLGYVHVMGMMHAWMAWFLGVWHKNVNSAGLILMNFA